MKNDIIAVIIVGSLLLLLLLLIALFYGVRKFNKGRSLVDPNPVEIFPSRRSTKFITPIATPIIFNIPEDFGIGHQRKDQLPNQGQRARYSSPPNAKNRSRNRNKNRGRNRNRKRK